MEKPTYSLIFTSLILTIISTSIPCTVLSQLSVSSPTLTACPELLLPVSSKIDVYLQYQFSGANESVYQGDQSPINPSSPEGFGVIRLSDDKLTAGPDYNSPEVGRAQGTATSADLNLAALAMNLNFYFTAGIYNGSTLHISGRNPVFTQRSRELIVDGGTGIFRCARGYVITSTYSADPVTGDRVLLYTFYVNYDYNI